jgi:hypothetical protein
MGEAKRHQLAVQTQAALSAPWILGNGGLRILGIALLSGTGKESFAALGNPPKAV